MVTKSHHTKVCSNLLALGLEDSEGERTITKQFPKTKETLVHISINSQACG